MFSALYVFAVIVMNVFALFVNTFYNLFVIPLLHVCYLEQQHSTQGDLALRGGTFGKMSADIFSCPN